MSCCVCVFTMCVCFWWFYLFNLLCIGVVIVAFVVFVFGGVNSVVYDSFYWLCLLVLLLLAYCLSLGLVSVVMLL